MGNILSSDKNERNESVINLSDNCVGRITQEDRKCAERSPKNFDDKEWIQKLKCMDDVHSQKNDITYQCVLDLIRRIEVKISDYRPSICENHELITCLKKNENCMIKCKKYIDDFIDCVDAYRITIIKQKYETDKKSNVKEENKLAKQFLKDDK